MLAVVTALGVGGIARVVGLAVATGALYGITAALMKMVTGQLAVGGLLAPLSHPAVYLVCLVGPAGFLLSQSTFQHGAAVAPALAVITVVDPLVGVAAGAGWLGERIDHAPAAMLGQLVAVLTLIVGIAILSRRDGTTDAAGEAGAGQLPS